MVFAVAWAGREVTDAASGTTRDGAAVMFLDREGQVLDGPRLVQLPRPEATGARAVRVRPPITRLPHIVGMGKAGFAVAWEEEGEGLITVALAGFGPNGGEPLWAQRVLPDDTAARHVQGRIPFLAFHAEAARIAAVWIDRASSVPELDVSLFDTAGTALGTSLAARGSIRYHGALFVGGDVATVRWSRAAARLGLTLCPIGAGCPEPPATEDPAAGIPVASLGGRPGLAPGAARGEFAAVWREKPGAASTDAVTEAEDAPAVGHEIFFVRFRCGGQ